MMKVSGLRPVNFSNTLHFKCKVAKVHKFKAHCTEVAVLLVPISGEARICLFKYF